MVLAVAASCVPDYGARPHGNGGDGGDGELAGGKAGGHSTTGGSEYVAEAGMAGDAIGGGTKGTDGNGGVRSDTTSGAGGVPAGAGGDRPELAGAGTGGSVVLAGGNAGDGSTSTVGGAGAGGIGGEPGDCPHHELAVWSDDFDGASLSPAWTTFQYSGERHNGQSSPANHLALVPNPGVLRYFVDPLTFGAPWLDYAPFFHEPYRWYDPGAELTRGINGDAWALDVKVTWYVPLYVNAAGHYVAVHFGEPGTSGHSYAVRRYSNDDTNAGKPLESNFIRVIEMEAGNVALARFDDIPDYAELATLTANITRYVRFERVRDQFFVSLSKDGMAWPPPVVAATIPESFRCSPQRVSITGEAWYSPQGSYADYDSVRLHARAKRVFLTEGAWPPTFGGVAAADAYCDAEARSAGIEGQYRAWLGDESTTAPSRIARSADGYARTDGVLVANDYADLTDGGLNAPINVSARGEVIQGVQAWSNIHLGGSVYPGTAACQGWATDSASAYGWTGKADEATSEWTESQLLPCGPYRKAHFYCFER